MYDRKCVYFSLCVCVCSVSSNFSLLNGNLWHFNYIAYQLICTFFGQNLNEFGFKRLIIYCSIMYEEIVINVGMQIENRKKINLTNHFQRNFDLNIFTLPIITTNYFDTISCILLLFSILDCFVLFC